MPPKRAAAESVKAKQAAAIASSESKEIEAKKALLLGKKPRGRPRKADKKPEPIADDDDEYEEDDDKAADDDAAVAAQKAKIDNIIIESASPFDSLHLNADLRAKLDR